MLPHRNSSPAAVHPGGRAATIPLAGGAGAGAGAGVLDATATVVRRAVRRATPATLTGVRGAPTIASTAGANAVINTPPASMTTVAVRIAREGLMSVFLDSGLPIAGFMLASGWW